VSRSASASDRRRRHRCRRNCPGRWVERPAPPRSDHQRRGVRRSPGPPRRPSPRSSRADHSGLTSWGVVVGQQRGSSARPRFAAPGSRRVVRHELPSRSCFGVTTSNSYRMGMPEKPVKRVQIGGRGRSARALARPSGGRAVASWCAPSPTSYAAAGRSAWTEIATETGNSRSRSSTATFADKADLHLAVSLRRRPVRSWPRSPRRWRTRRTPQEQLRGGASGRYLQLLEAEPDLYRYVGRGARLAGVLPTSWRTTPPSSVCT